MSRWVESCVGRPADGALDPVVVSWSGGKDAALALQAVLGEGTSRVESLLTTVSADSRTVAVHGVPTTLVRAQAESMGLPLTLVPTPAAASNELYEAAQRAALHPFRARGARRVVSGDIHLEDVRAYRDTLFASLGMEGLYPLWGMDSAGLAARFVAQGFRAVLVVVDEARLDARFVGREFDRALLEELPAGVDPCGERGEFHTFVYDGPIFREAVPVTRGDVGRRDGFAYQDLTLQMAARNS